MARIVVIATGEVGPDVLAEHVGPADDVVVVVPAVEQSRLEWLANDESDARARAQEVGESIAADAPASEAVVQVSREVPSQAVLDAIAEQAPDLVIVALRDGEGASWLEDGELAQIPGQLAGVPVTRISI